MRRKSMKGKPALETSSSVSRASSSRDFGPATMKPTMSRLRACSVTPSSGRRSEEHTSELQSLMRISYAVFCLKKKKTKYRKNILKKRMNQNSCVQKVKNQQTNNIKIQKNITL